jgi:hypothetical protein
MHLHAVVRTVLIGAVVAALASPAAAQQPSSESNPESRFSLASSDLFSAPPQGGGTPVVVRGLIGGQFWGGGSGLVLGAGIGTRPFNNRQIEVTGDVSFLRFEGHNGFYIAADGLYHFITDEPNFSPYAGAGIGVFHLADDTEARFQILAGLELNSRGRYPIRPEVRFHFARGDVSTFLLLHIQLAQR